jgi:hypothetical protein
VVEKGRAGRKQGVQFRRRASDSAEDLQEIVSKLEKAGEQILEFCSQYAGYYSKEYKRAYND